MHSLNIMSHDFDQENIICFITKFYLLLYLFFQGVVDGVTGVVLQPISGAKEEGVGGFVKGVAKGVVGLVAKPTSGVFDFASNSLDLVRRAADPQGTIPRARPPRYLDSSGTVRPYSRQSAEGNEVLAVCAFSLSYRTVPYHLHLLQNFQRFFCIA